MKGVVGADVQRAHRNMGCGVWGVSIQDHFAKNTDEVICLKYIGESL